MKWTTQLTSRSTNFPFTQFLLKFKTRQYAYVGMKPSVFDIEMNSLFNILDEERTMRQPCSRLFCIISREIQYDRKASKSTSREYGKRRKKASKKQIGNKFKLHSGMLCFYMEMKKNLEAVFIPFR